MNAAARLLSQNSLAKSWVFSILLKRTQPASILLLLLILTSALATIYVTNVSRTFHAQLQSALQQKDDIHAQWNQLLLEKSTWLVPARVQKISESAGMVYPDKDAIVIVHH